MLKLTPAATLLITITLLFTGKAAFAQPYYFRHYQVENGLSNNTVYCALQDSTGFLWFGTKEGLNRFDGYKFKLFKLHSNASDWAERELIYCLFNDQHGKLWVGTQTGLFCFDKEREQLVPYFPELPEINGIQSDAQGKLWFISRSTVYRYNPADQSLKEFKPDQYFSATSLCITPSKEMWFSARDGKLYRFRAETERFEPFEVYSHSPKFTSCSIEKIISGGPETIYIGTTCQGIKELNTKTGEYKDVLIYNPDKTPVYVRDILEYSENEFWFATESGVFILDKRKGQFTNIKKKFLDPYSLNDNAVYTLCKDREGGVWAGTYFGGINYYAKQYSTFEKYFADNSNKALRGSAIREMKKDRYGNLWIGTEDAGLNKLNPITGEIAHFSPDGSPGSISYSNIHGLLAAGDELWIGTHEHGLDIMDIRTGKVKKHFDEGFGAGDLTNSFVVSLLKTKNGNIYAGTGNSIHLYHPKTKTFTRCREIPDHVLISTMIEAEDGTIWAGTHGYGVYYFNPGTGENGRFEHHAGDPESLTANTINSIIEDTDKNIWIGTEGGGAVIVSKTKKIIGRYSTRTGLPSNFIFKILEDRNKNIWLTSSKGLINIQPRLKRIKVFTTSSGLLNDQFNYNSGYCDENGDLYFGSVKGMIRFRPEKCASINIVPPVYITGLQVNNEELPRERNGGVRSVSVTHAREVTLSHDQASVSFDFAALSYTSPDMTRYKYKMDGVDKEWTELAANRKVYFTDLSPGSYAFRVKAGINGVWAASETKLVVHITPPFWASSWAYLGYGVILILVIYVLARFLHQRAQEKKEKEIYAAKIDFFTNVAHEIRTPLTLIKGPVENISEHIAEYPEIQEDVQTLGRNTDRLISLVSGVLDFRKTETSSFSLDFTKVDLRQIVEENFLDFKPLSVKGNLSYELDISDDIYTSSADEDALNKIISNLFSNAVKYAATRIHIKLRLSGTNLAILEVISDGHKITDSMREKVFEPFFRIKETNKQKGAGIGLALARSLAELHNGKLYLKTDDLDSNIFVLELPRNIQKSDLKHARKAGQQT